MTSKVDRCSGSEFGKSPSTRATDAPMRKPAAARIRQRPSRNRLLEPATTVANGFRRMVRMTYAYTGLLKKDGDHASGNGKLR
jgi:hypothetical protein